MKERESAQDMKIGNSGITAGGTLPAEITELEEAGKESIVLIDGVCHLCQWIVAFIIPRDPEGRFRFAPLQSDIGRYLLKRGGLNTEQQDTVVLIEQGRYYSHSAAALRILRRLHFPWPVAYALIVIPAPLRDRLYRFVARNRYRWFGRDDRCLMPTPDIKRRFL